MSTFPTRNSTRSSGMGRRTRLAAYAAHVPSTSSKRCTIITTKANHRQHTGHMATSTRGIEATTSRLQNLSTIPDILKFKVVDTIENKFIGTLDQRFVGDLDKDQIFVLRGSQWRVLNIDEKSFKINVLPIRSSQEIPVPKWEGVNIPVDFKTANKVGAFRTKVQDGSLKMVPPTPPTIPMSSTSIDQLEGWTGTIDSGISPSGISPPGSDGFNFL